MEATKKIGSPWCDYPTNYEGQSCDRPVLLVNLSRVHANARTFKSACSEVFPHRTLSFFYATKAHYADSVITGVVRSGFGLEVISEAGLADAVSRAVPLIVSGYVKPKSLLRRALTLARYIVIEHEWEVEQLRPLSDEIGVRAAVLVRVKSSPTARIGLSIEAIERSLRIEWLSVLGLHFHLGWNKKDPLFVAVAMAQLRSGINAFARAKRRVEVVNFGGSFCEHQEDETQLPHRLKTYAGQLPDEVERVDFEPGRFIVGDAGLVMCKIVEVEVTRREVLISTCAYGFKLSGASARASVDNPTLAEGSTPWTVIGIWSSEGDIAYEVPIHGTPRVGATLFLHNLGAYSLAFRSQFSTDGSLDVKYVNDSSSLLRCSSTRGGLAELPSCNG